MTIEYTISGIDKIGRINVRGVDLDTEKITERYVLVPGKFTDAVTWEATDISAQPDLIKNAAVATWTLAIIAAYKLAMPFVPERVDPDAPRKAQIAADPDFQQLMQQAAQATPTQIKNWLTANVTTLAQARGVLAALIFYVATRP